MTEVKHTPLSYRVEKNSQGANLIVSNAGKIALLNCLPEQEENAAFIVRACNSHYDLLEAAEFAHQLIDRVGDHRKDADILQALSDALAKAKGAA